MEEPYILVGQAASIFYFSYFLLFIPLVGNIENILYRLYILKGAE